MSGLHPPGFNEVLHAPVRLTLVSVLAPAVHVEFAYLREVTGLTDSALSKQVGTLQDAGYVELHRHGRRATVQLTAEGRRALAEHAAALRALLGDALQAAPEVSGAG